MCFLKFDNIYIKNKLKGCLAETIFELLHFEMGCQVYRTGHEFLYPHLFHLANAKKRDYHEKIKKEFVSNIINTEKDIGRINAKLRGFKRIEKTRFKKSKIGSTLSSTPDFTIITPLGHILQFEVKYRYNGKLNPSTQKKYLKQTMEESPIIFVVMQKEPYIKIYLPEWDISNKEEYSKMLDFYYKKIQEQRGLNRPLNDGEWEIVEKLGDKHFEAKLEYWSRGRGKDGSIIVDFIGIWEDCLIYPKWLLDKYSKVVHNCFNKE